MTVKEAARLLGLTVNGVHKMIATGTLSAVKHGPIWWIEPEALDAVRNRPKPGRPKRKESEGKSI